MTNKWRIRQIWQAPQQGMVAIAFAVTCLKGPTHTANLQVMYFLCMCKHCNLVSFSLFYLTTSPNCNVHTSNLITWLAVWFTALPCVLTFNSAPCGRRRTTYFHKQLILLEDNTPWFAPLWIYMLLSNWQLWGELTYKIFSYVVY